MSNIDVQKEIAFLRSEVIELRRNQSSRRGLEGPKGPKGDTGPQGPAGTVRREEVKAHVAELYPEMAQEVARRVPLDFVEKTVRSVSRKFIDSL